MDRILKIFVTGPEQQLLAEKLSVIETYQGFLLVKLAQEEVAEIASRYPVEDISAQYSIRAGQRQLDADLSRVDELGKTRDHPAYKGVAKLSSGAHHYLVQFIGPVKKSWLDAVSKAGGKLRSPSAGFCYVVSASEASLKKIVALPFVRWTGHLCHSDRISPSVLKFAKRKASETGAELPRTQVLPGLYDVEFFDKTVMNKAAQEIKKLGFEILESDKAACLMILRPANAGNVTKRMHDLSAVHGVRFIREHSLKRTSNDLSPRLMGAAEVQDSNGLGLDGAGEVVAICDTGLDTGDTASIHPDFKGRVAKIISYPIKNYYTPYIKNPGGNDGAADYDSGHGTHVTGSVLGDGSASEGLSGIEGPIRGLAHKAKLVFQAVEQEMQWKNAAYYQSIGRYMLAGIPNDIQTLFAEAYNNKARIHSNSWGGGEPGVYDSQSEQLDRFVWEHKDFCILVAAGNDGSDKDGDGKINSNSVTSPATAKNCICVGACENERPNFNSKRYGDWWPDDYPVAPFKNDPMADNPGDIVAFSSRGPTADGRIRPDIVAPGTFILSTRSTMIANNNTAWAAFPASRKYFHMGGTSMATPLAAGAATLVRQYLRRDVNLSSPSAALIKAVLIAGARRLPAGAGALVDNDQGFGRIDLEAVLNPATSARVEFLDIAEGLDTGEIWSRELAISSSDIPLRLVLVYSDYPGESLVNNLNLMLTAPDGTRHVGNANAGAGLTMDATNNVEVIQINAPAQGSWRIEVVASSVPESAQDFALVIMAAQGEPAESGLVRVTSSPDTVIPDNNSAGIHDALIVTQTGTVTSLAVEVDIQHTYIGDLIVELFSPEGISAVLHDREGARTEDIRKRYDVHNAPELQRLVASDITGEWLLSVSDHAGVDVGSLRQWTLEIIAETSTWEEAEAEPAQPIPDNKAAGISDQIEISTSGNITALEVWLDITHTWIGDLEVNLSSPSGVSVQLHGRSGGDRDNLITMYDVESLPTLSAFINTPGAGSWTLSVSDNAGRDTGKLNAWGLRVKL